MTDLFALSKCNLILGTGGSTFSAWASFLGIIPILTIPGQSFDFWKLINNDDHWIDTYDPESPNSQKLSRIKMLMG